MKNIRLQFASALKASQWLERMRPVLKWHDASHEDGCSLELPLDYPIALPTVKSAHAIGLETVSAKIKRADIPVFVSTMQKHGTAIARAASVVSFSFEAHTKDRLRLATILRISVKRGEVELFYAQGYGTYEYDVSLLTQNFGSFFSRMQLEIPVQKSGDTITYIPPAGVQLRTNWPDMKGRPSAVRVTFRDGNWEHYLHKMMEQWLALEAVTHREPEFQLTFPNFKNEAKGHSAGEYVRICNQCAFPLKKVRAEIYYTIDSALDLEGLVNLGKEASKGEGSAMDLTIASLALPSGLKGWITATARKNGLLLEVHSQNHHEEDDFLLEGRAVLKNHLPK